MDGDHHDPGTVDGRQRGAPVNEPQGRFDLFGGLVILGLFLFAAVLVKSCS